MQMQSLKMKVKELQEENTDLEMVAAALKLENEVQQMQIEALTTEDEMQQMQLDGQNADIGALDGQVVVLEGENET